MTWRQRSESSGQSITEFALLLPVLVLIFLGIFDAGRAVYTYNTIANASREAARVAIVSQNETAIRQKGLGALPALDPTLADVRPPIYPSDPRCSPSVRIGCPVTIEVRYSWQAMTPVVGNIIGPITMIARTTMAVERPNPDP